MAYEGTYMKNTIIKVAMRKMSVPYKELLSGLSSTFSQLDRMDFLKDKDDLDGTDGHEDNNLFDGDDGDGDLMVPRVNAEPLQHVFPPPMVAPFQIAYHIAEAATLTPQEKRKCVFFPFCQKMARECGGLFLDKPCRAIKESKVILPTDYREKIEAAKRVEKNRYLRENYEKKKRAKVKD
jgi:hypothetical protein